jgi:polyribonucleotide nucleotidyltransferase
VPTENIIAAVEVGMIPIEVPSTNATTTTTTETSDITTSSDSSGTEISDSATTTSSTTTSTAPIIAEDPTITTTTDVPPTTTPPPSKPQYRIVINPTKQEQEQSALQMVIAGSIEGILMVEGSAFFLPEEEMLSAIQLAHSAIKQLCIGIQQFQCQSGKKKQLSTLRTFPKRFLYHEMKKEYGEKISIALTIAEKRQRGKQMMEIQQQVEYYFQQQLKHENQQQLLLLQQQQQALAGKL